jgi:hypothetical protein
MMTPTQRGPRAGASGNPGGPGYSEARLLGLRTDGARQCEDARGLALYLLAHARMGRGLAICIAEHLRCA